MSDHQAIMEKNNEAAQARTDIAVPDDLPEDMSQGIRDTRKIRRIVIDRIKCIGAQSCTVLTPELLKMDDENLAYVNDPNANNTDDEIMMSAQSCPVLAVLLYDEEGNKLFPEE